MKYLLILTLILSILMFYMGFAQHFSMGIFFGAVLLLTCMKFVMDILAGRKEKEKDDR